METFDLILVGKSEFGSIGGGDPGIELVVLIRHVLLWDLHYVVGRNSDEKGRCP